jgi:hypothetical protein
MSESKRPFWSTTAGVVTGVASVLTAIVGLLTVSINLGWLGSKNDARPAASASSSTSSAASTTTFGATTTTPSGRTGTTSASSSLTPLQATPLQLTFDSLGPRDQQVTVRNTSAAAVTLRPPAIAGVDSTQFTATDLTCGTRLDANRTCEVRVTFLATKTGASTATLVVQPDGVPALEVPLRGSRLI